MSSAEVLREGSESFCQVVEYGHMVRRPSEVDRAASLTADQAVEVLAEERQGG